MRNFLLVFAFVLGFSFTALAAGKDEIITLTPQFVSLKANETILRTGPGTQYPIDWEYHAKGLPVELLAKYGNWRKIKDMDGTTGWVIRGKISVTRTFRAIASTTLKRNPAQDAASVAKLESGTLGNLISCPKTTPLFCRVEVQGYQGWLAKGEIFGTYPNEVIE